MRAEHLFLSYLEEDITQYQLDKPEADAQRRRYVLYQLEYLVRDFFRQGNDLALSQAKALRDRLLTVPQTSPANREMKAYTALPAPQIENPYTLYLMKELGILPEAQKRRVRPLSKYEKLKHRKPVPRTQTAAEYFRLDRYPLKARKRNNMP